VATLATVGSIGVNIFASVGSFEKSLRRMRRQLKSLGDWAANTLKWTIGIGLATGALAVKAFAEQEAAETSLRATLETHGYAVAGNMLKYQELAAQIQRTTIYGDEFAMGLMTSGLNLGISAEQIGTVTQQALGLAQALGIDTTMAMRAMALATQGNFTMLSRYMPALRGVTDATKGLKIVQDAASQGLVQAEAYSKTLAGQWEQLKNAAGDLAEAVGGKIVDALGGAGNMFEWVKLRVEALTIWVKNLDAEQLGLIATWAKWVLGALAFLAIVPKIITATLAMASAFRTMGLAKVFANPIALVASLAAVGVAALATADLVGKTSDAFGGSWDRAITQAQTQAQGAADNASKESARRLEDIEKQQVDLQKQIAGNTADKGVKPWDYHNGQPVYHNGPPAGPMMTINPDGSLS
jgi:hypothetical protein